MATGVRDDVGYEYTCFMRGGEDARLHERFSGGQLSSDVEGSSALDFPLIHDALSQDQP
jgi:hypothetical protein